MGWYAGIFWPKMEASTASYAFSPTNAVEERSVIRSSMIYFAKQNKEMPVPGRRSVGRARDAVTMSGTVLARGWNVFHRRDVVRKLRRMT